GAAVAHLGDGGAGVGAIVRAGATHDSQFPSVGWPCGWLSRGHTAAILYYPLCYGGVSPPRRRFGGVSSLLGMVRCSAPSGKGQAARSRRRNGLLACCGRGLA